MHKVRNVSSNVIGNVVYNLVEVYINFDFFGRIIMKKTLAMVMGLLLTAGTLAGCGSDK